VRGGGLVRDMHHHAVAIGEDHAAVGAGERVLHLPELLPRHIEQLAVARERGVQAAGRDGIEGHDALAVGMGAGATHP
jgi:hypothetical protein